MTVWPSSGETSPVPWISAIVAVVGSVPGPVPGSVPEPEFCGVMAAESVKSALLSSVSTPPVRLRDLTSVLPAGAFALAVSNVLEMP